MSKHVPSTSNDAKPVDEKQIIYHTKSIFTSTTINNSFKFSKLQTVKRPHPIQTLQTAEPPPPPDYDELTPVTCVRKSYPSSFPRQEHKRDLQCYRIIYRGIVSLLSSPGSNEKSGAYVSYGEIIASSESIDVPIYDEALSPPSTPTARAPISPTSSLYSQSTSLSLPLSLSTSSHSRMISTVTSIRVDEVLTGGYSVENGDLNEFGYINTHHLECPIAEKVPPPRLCESGRFRYRVVSRTPLNILLGPCGDAALTRGMAIPGSVHDVCLRIQLRDDVVYLRLNHRRGWIADRKIVGIKVVMVMEQVEDQNFIQVPRRRKRMLRRVEETSPNVTMISDDLNDLHNDIIDHLPPPTPSFFLMRVRAPKGLKILDAPQFQVNRLIHGKATNPSIFQTMTGFGTSSQRILPRGSLFEASKRIEGLYNSPGSGSIKLSDNSGWVIVQTQTNAYEEIGTAIPSLPSLWLRILPRAGVVLACPNDKKDITLPCGLCVEVDPWEQTSQRQSFARLRSGIAWIPRHIHNELFSYIIQTPKIRFGKFHFQVTYKRGMKIRQGPSRRAPSILSNNEPIRYECGEFLLISDIFTMFGPTDTSSSHDANLSECFGQLYNTHHWVHIHSNGRYYLQETHPPSIEHSNQGWRYNCILEHSFYSGPSFFSQKKRILRVDESILVHERITYDEITWFKAKEGYIPNLSQDNELVMVLNDLHEDNKGQDNLISRFFAKDELE